MPSAATRRRAHTRDAGDRRERTLDAILKPDQVGWLRKEFGRAPDAESEEALRPEAWIRAEQVLDAANDEPAAAEEHER